MIWIYQQKIFLFLDLGQGKGGQEGINKTRIIMDKSLTASGKE
jgi:hypothetical protein